MEQAATENTSKDSDDLLRKKEGKIARLIEIISKETMEVGTSRRRHQKTGGAA